MVYLSISFTVQSQGPYVTLLVLGNNYVIQIVEMLKFLVNKYFAYCTKIPSFFLYVLF